MRHLLSVVGCLAVAFSAFADYRVEYPDRVAKRPPLRGVMLPPEKVTEKHFRTLKEWGVTLGRYQMMPTGPDAWLTTTNCARYVAWLDAKLDTLASEVLPLANRHGIQLVVDIHVPPGGRDGQIMHMCDKQEYLDCFVDCWKRIALRLKGRPGIYGYDLINEPDQKREAKIADYLEVQRRAAEAVRAIDPDTTILVASNGWNKPDNFAYLSPLAMDNVIYQVHVYQPMAFTHQGVLPKYKDDVTRWPDESKGWNKEWLRKLLEPVRAFQQRHHAKIYAGEFSAVSWAEGADRYLSELISLFEEYGWDWSYHAFREWPGWDAEKVCIANARRPDKAKFRKDPDNPRLRVLRDAFAGRTNAVTVTVSPERKIGPVKPVNGVGQPPMVGAPTKFSLMHYLKDAGIPYARLHDVGGQLGRGLYVDIPNLFPDFDADETRPENYRFDATDALCRALEANGVEPFFRLGVTIENFVAKGVSRRRTLPPKDFEKWARICEQVVRHYTEGWADGFKMKIGHWEVWNEPDNEPDAEKNPMWGGSFDDYIRLYGTVATHLKTSFPHLKIGGYGSCGFYAGVGADGVKAAHSSPRTDYFVSCAEKFLSAVRTNGWPLDFFSFHSYSDPAEAIRQVEFADRLLDRYGFAHEKTERVFNEWMPFVSHENLGSAKQAAGIAAELIGLQNGPCDIACLYDARCDVGNYSPLFNPLTYKPHKAYDAFVAFNELRKLGTAVQCTSSDPSVWAAAASCDGRTVLMAANVSDRAKPFFVRGLPGEASGFLTDETRSRTQTGVPSELPPHSILLLKAEAISENLLSATPVWLRGRTTERNLTVGFRISFDGKDAAELRYSASSIARVWLNGEFLCYGPARGPHGIDRVDVIPLAGRVRNGRNVLAFEVAGYNVESFYLLNEPAYLAAEIRARDGRVLARTEPDGPFEATVITERMQKVPRFSYQRPFCEVYRLKTGWSAWRTGGTRPTAPLAAVAGSPWIERTAPYPAYDVSRVFRPIRQGRLGNRAPTKLHEGRSVTGEDDPKRGYAKSEIAVQPVYEIQRLSNANYVLYDHGLCDTGFLGAKVVCRKPGRVYFYFDEVLVDDDVDVSRMGWQCVNALTYDFEEPGEYAIEAFEPNTFRYLKVMFDGFEGEVSDLFVRGYKNGETGRVAFESSDPALNEIFAAARETFVQNAVDALTDCPSRERAGWLCDSFFSGRSERWLTGSNPVERCFLENFARTSHYATKEDRFLPMCYPADAGLLPNWNFWFVFELEDYLARTGDRALIELMRPKVEGVIASFRKYRNADGLLEKLPGWVFIEWSEANKLVQDVNYPSNMTYAKMLEVAARLYGWTDCAEEARKVRETVRRQSWTGEWFCDNAVRQKDGTLKLSGECTETCQYYAFFMGLADAGRYPELWNRLVSDFGPKRRETKAWPKIHPANAFIGNYLRLELLSRAGLSARILDETKGYLHGMARRTGTLWEHDNISNSCDHGFASHAAVVLFRDVLGVRSVDPVTRRIVLEVDSALPLDNCRGTVPLSATEELRVEWRKTFAGLDVRFEAPKNWTVVRR